MTSTSRQRYACGALLVLVAAACHTRNPEAVKAVSIRRGDQFVSNRQYAQAAVEYRAILDLDPGNGRVRMKLATTYSLAGNYPQASVEAIRAADQLPGNVEAQTLAAEMMLTQVRYVDATDRMSVVLQQHPDDVRALILWGNATARLYNSTWALYTLADDVRHTDTLDAARRDLRQWVSPSDDAAAEAAFRKALGLAPALQEAQLALVNFLWATGRFDESRKLLTDIADKNPNHEIANYALGQLELAHQQNIEAERHLQNAAAGSGEFARRARLTLVDYYVAAHRDREARSVLESMKPADDAAGELSVRLAADDARSGKPGDAVRRLDLLLTRSPHHADALLLKAQILLQMGNPDLRYARAAVADASGSSNAHATLGQAFAAAGDREHAVEQYVEALRLNPDAREPRLALARLSLALERGPEALQYARDAVRLDPDNQDAVLILVKALILEQDYATADLALKPLLSRFPDAPDVLVQAGAIQVGRRNDSAARTAFTRALQFDPDSLDALSGLVAADVKPLSGDMRHRVETAVAAHPYDPGYLLLAARAYAAAQDAKRTEAILRKVLDIDRANVKATVALSDFLVRERRPDEAIVVLKQGVERHPLAVNLRTSLATLQEDTGHTAEARKQYEQIVSLDPTAAVASYRLAALYAAQGANLDVALGLAVAAKQQLLTDPAVSDTVGWIYTLKNLPDLALPQLLDAVRAAPNNPVYHYHLGSAYQRAGALAQANTEFTTALQIDGAFAYADQARRAVAALRK